MNQTYFVSVAPSGAGRHRSYNCIRNCTARTMAWFPNPHSPPITLQRTANYDQPLDAGLTLQTAARSLCSRPSGVWNEFETTIIRLNDWLWTAFRICHVPLQFHGSWKSALTRYMLPSHCFHQVAFSYPRTTPLITILITCNESITPNHKLTLYMRSWTAFSELLFYNLWITFKMFPLCTVGTESQQSLQHYFRFRKNQYYNAIVKKIVRVNSIFCSQC